MPLGGPVLAPQLLPMSTKTLALLVLAVIAGTAVSVRWYLAADAAVAQVRERVSPRPVREHVSLPLRANPARSQQVRPEENRPGVAFRPAPAPRAPATEATLLERAVERRGTEPPGSSTFDAL